MFRGNFGKSLPVAAFAVLCLAIAGCSENKAPPNDEAVKVVSVQQVGDDRYYSEHRFPGLTQAANKAQLSFAVSGTIQSVSVDIGSMVKAGDELASLDAEPYEIALENAYADEARAVANVTEQEAEYERVRRLREQNAVSQRELEAVTASYQDAMVSLTEAQARIKLAKRELSQTILNAPYDGVIAERQIEPHEEVSAAQVAFSIDSISSITVESVVPFYVFEELLDASSNLSISVNFRGASFQGSIAHIGRRANSALGMPIKIAINNPAQNLLPTGAVVEVVFRNESHQGAISVPHGAVFTDPSTRESFIFVHDQQTDTVHQRPAHVVDMQPSRYWIQSELEPGAQYVSAGAAFLRDGQKVTVAEEMK